ncbi:MAG: PAS domain S-box protein [Chloroflexi bacterium]|nr:MAG: PAS domain S-box protein [Chloroflexota bacterium]
MSRVPIDEAGRLESLNRLDLLGSAPEERFDRITRLARRLLGTPAAVIALVGVDRVWLKSALGLAPREVSRPGTHFERALGSRRPYTHSGSEPDPLGMRSFAGKSLAEPAGHRVGVLAVMDPDLREFGEDDLELLVDLAAVAERELGRSAFDRMLDEYRGHAAWAQSVMDNVAEALVTIDQEGRIRSVNRAGVAMFRRPVGALIGSTVPQMLAPEDQDELDRILRQHLAAPAESFSVHREVTALGGDGTRFPVEIDLGGTWITEDETMLVAVIRDITERKSAEARLVDALQKQERAIEDLDRISKAKSYFVSLVGHEFRTALTGIQGFSELLAEQDFDPEEVKEFAREIHNEGKRLTRMISEMLDLERMESGRMQLNYSELDLNRVVAEVADRFQATTQQHWMLLDLDAHLPKVEGDADKLTQVVANLVSNAIKYSPHGGDVLIKTGSRDGEVWLSIADHGLGLPPEALDTIFERYARHESKDRESIGGTGLGLPLVRQIVEMHGGRVRAESEQGKGSTFTFSIPIQRRE